MATKTFSGRADIDKLAYAEALAQREYGMSYGQFCATVLLEAVNDQHSLPGVTASTGAQVQRAAALSRMRQMSERLQGSRLASMGDEELKQLIASRYE